MDMKRKRATNNQINAGLFFLFLLLGVASIITLKTLEADQIIVTSVPVMIMLLYAIIVYWFRRLRLRLDQAGDNLYYLGFLYTLTSLAYSLVEFGIKASSPSSIIANFGIAIATTITGLALRVLFNQLRIDPAETEHLARAELAIAARRLKSELGSSARELTLFNKSLQQMTLEVFGNLQKEINKTLKHGKEEFENSIESISTTTKDLSNEISERANDISGNLRELSSGIDLVTKKLVSVNIDEDVFSNTIGSAFESIASNVKELHAVIADITEKLGNIDINEDVLEHQLAPSIDKFTASVDTLQKTTESDSERSSILIESVISLDDVIKRTDISFSKMENALQIFSNGANDLLKITMDIGEAAKSMNLLMGHLNNLREKYNKEHIERTKTRWFQRWKST